MDAQINTYFLKPKRDSASPGMRLSPVRSRMCRQGVEIGSAWLAMYMPFVANKIHIASGFGRHIIAPAPSVIGTNALCIVGFAGRMLRGQTINGKVRYMPANMSVEKRPEKTASESGTPPPGGGSPTLTISQASNLCATGLLICFFLPWAQILGQSISGFDLQKLGGNQKLLWLIPISCAMTIIAGYMKQGQKSAAQFAGVLPFFALAYWVHLLGVDVVKNVLAFGAYAGLGLGLALIVLSFKLKK